MILSNVEQDIASYDRFGLHYNVVADAIYKMREESPVPQVRAALFGANLGLFCGSGSTFPHNRQRSSPRPRLRRAPVLRAACGEGGTMLAQHAAQRSAG